MATTTITHRQLEASRSRQLIIGGIFLLIAFLLWFVLARDTTSDQITSFGLSLSGVTQQLPPLLVHSTQFLVILAVMSALFGGYQLARGFKRYTNLALTLVVGFLILGFLTWAAAGKSLNLAGLLVTTLGKAVPITMGALSGILCERAGVTNIAIEVMMLMSALVSSLFGSLAQSLWIGWPPVCYRSLDGFDTRRPLHQIQDQPDRFRYGDQYLLGRVYILYIRKIHANA